MPRERITDARERERRAAAATVAKAVSKKIGKRPRMAPISKVIDETEKMRKSGDWSSARAAHLVEAYCWFHGKVYGVRPAELDATSASGKQERLAAIGSAKSLIEKEFGGAPEDAARYLQWAWIREEGREDWARKNGKTRGRLTWRALFAGRGIFGDYQVAVARARSNGTK